MIAKTEVLRGFRVELTPDFHEDAKGMFKRPVETQFEGQAHGLLHQHGKSAQ